jgi:hypothetical protein
MPERQYEAKWFDPRSGEWTPAGSGTLASSNIGQIRIPQAPSDNDWGLRLVLQPAK